MHLSRSWYYIITIWSDNRDHVSENNIAFQLIFARQNTEIIFWYLMRKYQPGSDNGCSFFESYWSFPDAILALYRNARLVSLMLFISSVSILTCRIRWNCYINITVDAPYWILHFVEILDEMPGSLPNFEIFRLKTIPRF